MRNVALPGNPLDSMEQMREYGWRLLVLEAEHLTDGQELPELTAAERRVGRKHQELGVNTGKSEHRKWITAHHNWLREKYSLLRVAWLYRWRALLMESDMVPPKPVRDYPWLEWYFLILGAAPDDCAAEDWPLVLHQWYLQLFREERREFERSHTPIEDAWQSGTESWKDWQSGVRWLGVAQVEHDWLREAA